MASLVSQLSFVVEGMRIKISLSPRISAVQTEDLLTGLAEFWGVRDNFPSSIEGTIAKLFGPCDWACVTVIVLVEVFTATDVDVDMRLGIGVEEVVEEVEIATADIVLLLMEIAGADEKR